MKGLIWDPGAKYHMEGAGYSGLFSVWALTCKMPTPEPNPMPDFLPCPTCPRPLPSPLAIPELPCTKSTTLCLAPQPQGWLSEQSSARKSLCVMDSHPHLPPPAFTGVPMLTSGRGSCVELASPCRWTVGGATVGAGGVWERAGGKNKRRRHHFLHIQHSLGVLGQ